MSRKTVSMTAQEGKPSRQHLISTVLMIVAVAALTLSTSVFVRQQASASPASPALTVVTSPFVHDPSRILKEGNTYYAYSTGYNIPSLTSTDLTHWKSGPSVLPNGTPAWVRKDIPQNDGHNIWAPDVIFNHGLYYMYYAISGGKVCGIGLLTSPTLNPNAPNYKWTDRGPVIISLATDRFAAIDPAPFFDASGNMWLSWGSGYVDKPTDPEIFEIRLNKSTGLRSDNLKYAVENGHVEASYVYYHNGFYYLFWNTGGCCSGAASTYAIHVARSTTVTGPYTERSKHLFDASHGGIHGPGQIGILDIGSTSYYSYHYYPNSGGSVLGIGTLIWGSDGWPIAGS